MYNFHIPPQHIGFLRFQNSIARILSVVEKKRQKIRNRHIYLKISNNQKYSKFSKGSEIFFIPKCIGSKTGRFYAKCDLTMLDIDRILNKKNIYNK